MVFKFGEVASLDEVPAEFRFAYGAANAAGKFSVQPGAQPFVDAFQGQATALENERVKIRTLSNENAQRRTALKPWEDLLGELGLTVADGEDPVAAVRTLVGELTTKVKGGDAFKTDLAKIRTASEERIAALTATHTAELAAMSGTLEEYLVDKEALGALASSKAKGGGEVLLPTIKAGLKVVKDDAGKYVVRAVSADGQVRYNNSAQPMTVAEVVAETKNNPKYAFAFESESGTGTGHQPGSGKQAVRTTAAAGEMNATQKITAGLDALQKK